MQIRKHQHHEHRAYHSSAKDQRFELAPAGIHVVHQRAHDGVVERVEHAQHRQHKADL